MKRVWLMFLFLLPVQGYAWWSMWTPEDSTHYKISETAINALSKTDYPDIHRFADIIIKTTSGPKDDANAHGKIKDSEINYASNDNAGKYDGGDFNTWWDTVKLKYGRF